MSEETQNTEPQPTESTEPESMSNAEARNSPLFDELRKQLRASKDALATREQADKDAATAAAQKELEAKGEYTTLLQQKESEYATKEKAYETRLLNMELKTALVQSDMKDPLVLAGAMASFTGGVDDISPYVEQLKKDSPHHFTVSVEAGGTPAAAHGSAGSRSTEKSLEERLALGDADAQRQKWNELMGS